MTWTTDGRLQLSSAQLRSARLGPSASGPCPSPSTSAFGQHIENGVSWFRSVDSGGLKAAASSSFFEPHVFPPAVTSLRTRGMSRLLDVTFQHLLPVFILLFHIGPRFFKNMNTELRLQLGMKCLTDCTSLEYIIQSGLVYYVENLFIQPGHGYPVT